jgi:hypothetical protein
MGNELGGGEGCNREWRRDTCWVLLGKIEERKLGKISVNGWIILKWILKN